jgi:hypothetical protein
MRKRVVSCRDESQMEAGASVGVEREMSLFGCHVIFIVVDDYGVLPQYAQANNEFRVAPGITAPIELIDSTGVFRRKEF